MNIARLAVKRPVTITMLVLAVMLFGMVGFSRLVVSLLPDLSYPTLTVRTENAGAAPAEIEQLISKPIEESVGVVNGIRKLHSISKPGQSDLIIEFQWGTNMDLAIMELREKLDMVVLPVELRKPVILRFNPSLDPIIRLSISGNADTHAQLRSLRTYAEQELKRALEPIDGVAAVQLSGGLEQEVQVLLDQQQAMMRGITAETISNRIKSENINVSAGRVFDGQQEFLARTLNQFTNIEEIGDVIIKQEEGQTVYLKDIAKVIDGVKDRQDITRVNGNEAIEMALYKEGDANTVAVAKKVQAKIQQLRENLPENTELKLLSNQAEFIEKAIDEVKQTAIIGGLLAILVLYLFLGKFTPTLIIALAIPISIVATFNLMFANDISLNIMSLGGIALAIGLLVDNAIVVLENIYRKKEQGQNTEQAAIEGTNEVSGAVTASTLTTLAVFAPLAFVTGFAGEIFSDQALTVTFALLASLLVALSFIPTLASRQFSIPEERHIANTESSHDKVKTGGKKWLGYFLLPFTFVLVKIPCFIGRWLLRIAMMIAKILSWCANKVMRPAYLAFNSVYTLFAKSYEKILKSAMQQRMVVVVVCLIFAIAMTSLLPKVGMELMPEVAQTELTLELTLRQGTPIEKTDQQLNLLARSVVDMTGVIHTYSMSGTGSLMMSSATRGGSHWGQLVVKTRTPEQLTVVQEQLRTQLAAMANTNAEFTQSKMFEQERPLVVVLSGYQLNELKYFSDKLLATLQQQNRFADVTTTLREGQPELKIEFDHQRLSRLGLTAAGITDILATKIGGDVASKYNLDDRQVDIMVQVERNARNSVNAIRDMIVHGQDGQSVPLSSVARVTESIGPNEINRLDQARVAIITASVNHGDLSTAAQVVRSEVAALGLPEHIYSQVIGQNQQMEEAYSSLIMALLLAVFLVYLVMASQFESLLNPFIILISVPLAVLGAIFGLFITGTNLSVITFIGLIMLSGIVVNNAIVLIDRINQLRSKEMAMFDAIFAAATSRLRPIIMTTMTTVLGLLPMAMATGEGAELRAPLAITVMSGLLIATFLTLVLIPVLYSLFNQEKMANIVSVNKAEHEAR
ncbi:efflux RND transporter permease subunit [Thalassotalea sp. PP2-459]|uniref:efflux RND transporter permease subunit n=1 Tax=Thalassotalea sp. PP2-459 TaxID=1742724 RepID=UPI0009448541|nr:efflux RND transporter permease subunit [Thalassotalea sp. PP2-459]OKY25668.1 acriflavin resistance protein [Thalassotalea sp. PP2-459]